MIIIGITGSIGTGKSTIASLLKLYKIPVFDSDKEVKNLLENSDYVKRQIYKLWPEVVSVKANKMDIDKSLLSNKIFTKVKNRKILEKIIHPLVKKKRNLFIKTREKSHIIALDIPLLYETGTNKICDYVFLAYTNIEKQKQRVLSRPNMTEEKFYAINKIQWSNEEKRKKNPYLVSTSYGKSSSLIIISLYLLIIILKKKVFKI